MASLARIEKLAGMLGRDDPLVRRLVENARLMPDAAAGAEAILLGMCRAKGIDTVYDPAFDLPADMDMIGRLVGHVLMADRAVGEARISARDLPGNLGVFGGSGTGKSYLVGHLCEAWIQDGLTVVIFDLADEYGWLAERFAPDTLRVVSARKLPIGLFSNPVGSCLDDMARLGQVVSVLRESEFLRDGSCNVLTKTVGDMFLERGVLDGSRSYPLATEVLREVVSRKYSAQSRHAGYVETLVNRLPSLLQSFPGLNASEPLQPGQVLQRSLLIRMGDLSPGEIESFYGLFLAWLMAWAQGSVCDETRLVLVKEEVHLAVSKQKMQRYDLGEPLAVRVVRMARKHGMSTVVVDQVPSELPPAVLGNLATRVCFRLTNAPCAKAIGQSMGLDWDQMAELGELPQRHAVVQTARNATPFLIKVIDLPGRERPSEEFLRERERESLEGLDYELGDVDVVHATLGHATEQKRPKQDAELSGDPREVLEGICDGPEAIAGRCERLSMDRAREYRARQVLLKLGLIELGDRVGAKLQLYVPTAKGKAWAKSHGVEVHSYKSGVGHEFILRRVRQALGTALRRATFVSAGESIGLPGVQPDAVARLKGGRDGADRVVAIQVCVSSKPADEAEKALQLAAFEPVDVVVLVGKNKFTAAALERAVTRACAEADRPAGLVVLDFETCTEPDFDWAGALA